MTSKEQETTQLVSIIMPLYNAERFIGEAIESALNQSYENFELLIVDDKSTDSSVTMVKKYMQEDKRIKLFRQDVNSGPTKARNKAIKEAQGRYIAFLDSDDIWLPQKLEIQVAFMKENTLYLTYSAYETIDEFTNIINTRKIKTPISYEDMLKSNYIGNLTGIYDVDFFGKVYMEELGHEDYVMWLELIKRVPFTKGEEQSLAQYRILRHSISSNKIQAFGWQWKIYREIEKLNLYKSCYYFGHYVYNALKKRT